MLNSEYSATVIFMDIRNLKLFLHLTGTLHFARTSQACYITPSALTRVIQRLETEVGEKLFVRDNRTVELTQAGAAFKKYADDVIRRWEQFHDELGSKDVLEGELSLYCSVTAAYGILPGLMAEYRKYHPGVRIQLETGDAALAIQKLKTQSTDVVIAARPDNLPQPLEFKTLARTPLVFISSLDHQDAVVRKKGKIDWEKTPLIIPTHGQGRDRIDQWLASENFVPKIYSQVAGNEAILVMVSLGFGIGLVPLLVLEKSPFFNQVNIIEDAPGLPEFVIGLCTRKKSRSNPRIEALWRIAGEK